jgi:hypothetical protein
LHEAGYTSQRKCFEWGTVDLERHYYKTGERIGGFCELRTAWKFNDLKPRVYYCCGGDMYWPSRYMKFIAQAFMDALPLTSIKRRKNPMHMANYLNDDHVITLWDLESFTTNLSELKFFLFWVSRYLEHDSYVRQHPLTLFDYQEGIINRSVFEIIDEYNVECNIQGGFSVLRIADKIICDDVDTLYQQNSGMLGVGGNIGFSTSTHGITTAQIIDDTNHGVCVGDDVAAGTVDHPNERLIPHVSKIGRLHRDKTWVLVPQKEGEWTAWKFLKRRFERDFHGIHMDRLFSIFILSYVFDEHPVNRTIQPMTLEDRIVKFLSQVSALLWEILENGDIVSDDEIWMLSDILIMAYKKLGLPTRGSFPMKKVHDVVVPYAVPPVLFTDYDPRNTDWAEVLWSSRIQSFFSVPLRLPGTIPPPVFESLGQEFYASSTHLLRAMEDIGVVKEVRKLHEWLDARDDMNKRVFMNALHGEGFSVSLYSYAETPPHYYATILERNDSSLRVPFIEYAKLSF